MVRGTYRYQSHRELWTELRMRIREICVLLNREGWDVGKYLVYRLYKKEGLALKTGHNARGKQYGTGRTGS
jgi:putative transposase